MPKGINSNVSPKFLIIKFKPKKRGRKRKKKNKEEIAENSFMHKAEKETRKLDRKYKKFEKEDKLKESKTTKRFK